MSWLVLNTGSSSLKFGLFDPEARSARVRGSVDWHGGQAELTIRVGDGPESRRTFDDADPDAAAADAIRAVLDSGVDPTEIRGVGHRIVHGGHEFRESVVVTDAVEAGLRRLIDLDPTHNRPALAGLDAAKRALPGVPQVAAFDTSFFRDLPPSSSTLPVPKAWADDWGVRRFGFHGISHQYCAGRAAEILGRDAADADLRLVVCHLGNGCSASAIRGGKPVDTTMSFTPLDGLMMGTRSGSVDPGLLLYLLKEGKLDRDALDDALNHKSGLLGVSGVASDYRKVEEAADGGNPQARLALDLYAARVRSTIGGLAATLGGLDALVFAGGVGEHSSRLRVSACSTLGFLGVEVDAARNDGNPVDADVAAAGSRVRVLVISTEEELMIARDVRRLVGAG